METAHINRKVIFHIDMNSFYASVELVNHPEWRGKPLAIAGKPEERHGIIVTSSYEARRRGVRTTMTVQEARKVCPDLIVKHPDFHLYRAVSDTLFHLLKSCTPEVEKASIDEGYMDVTDLIADGHPLRLAGNLQHRIFSELGLPCSIGIAPNKFLAKMASNMKKPMGITVLRKRDLEQNMWPLPIGKMHGVGPSTEKRLQAMGIMKIGDLAATDQRMLSGRLGITGRRLWEHARGIDHRPVDPDAWERFKSIGHSVTLPRDTRSLQLIQVTLDRLSDKIAKKMKEKHIVGYGLEVMIRYHDWKTVTRHVTTVQPIAYKEDILSNALSLFKAHWNGKAVRLLGVTVSSFQPTGKANKQLDLFTYQEDAAREPLIKLINAVNAKFGSKALQTAASLISQKKK
ncbi:DNA polymerase IV [Sporolactobacillus sp. Y61]|jgi:DNA polymerase-4|uniref:DNA polymerase IV n=1 Tax=Sporolactobacillus sp. Y61 TaxID=3160863 RepID=A0AAU8IDS9_9BACL|nr:DNA polymerase IV [Sporolactobacillus sp. THM19-2]RYL93164.1 DNA polymerase IV [Sporolactobacillus sp. THM19-2]